jgi:hypothetical protein
LLATCQYGDIVPDLSTWAIRRMLSASAPSASATTLAPAAVYLYRRKVLH